MRTNVNGLSSKTNKDNNKIVKVLNHFIKFEENKYKNIYGLYVEDGYIILERFDKEKQTDCRDITTSYKISIFSYRVMLFRYKNGLSSSENIKELLVQKLAKNDLISSFDIQWKIKARYNVELGLDDIRLWR